MPVKKNIIFLVLILGSVFAFSAGKVHVVSPVDFYDRIKNDCTAIILDVRLYEDYCKGRIKNALWAGDKKVLIKLVEDKPKGQNIYLYCYEGRKRGKTAVDILLKKGYQNIFFLKGGFNEWAKRNMEIDRSYVCE